MENEKPLKKLFIYPCTAIKQPCFIPEKCKNCNCEELMKLMKMKKLIK